MRWHRKGGDVGSSVQTVVSTSLVVPQMLTVLIVSTANIGTSTGTASGINSAFTVPSTVRMYVNSGVIPATGT